MSVTYPSIDIIDSLDENVFKTEYLEKKPVLIKGFINNWPAVQKWDNNFLKSLLKGKKILTKFGNVQKEDLHKLSIDEFFNYADEIANVDIPPKIEDIKYIHDIPIFTLFENLISDASPFPEKLIPKWYRYQWWKKMFFFCGARHSLTPLHIDSLCANNFFFQIRGKKRFIFILKEEEKYCYPRDYSFYKVDPENPDYTTYPLFKKAHPMECIVEEGDMLYMPPVCLHQVRGLTRSVSINLDWHTRKSLFMALPRMFGNMAKSDIYYNFLAALGLVLGIPSKILQPFYQPYVGIKNAVQ